MRPTSPEREAARLYHACATRAEVYDVLETLRDDLLHASENGYDTSTPSATLFAFECMMEASGHDPEEG